MDTFIIIVIVIIFITINNIVHNITLAYCEPGPLYSALHMTSQLFPPMSRKYFKITSVTGAIIIYPVYKETEEQSLNT